MEKPVNLSRLPKIVAKRSKRLGIGPGSGKGGHTVGRGHKGQKARGKISIAFFGTKVKKSLLKRLPLQRGKGKLKGNRKPVVVNLKYLNLLKDDVVNIRNLVKSGIVDKDAAKEGVKILGEGEVDRAFTIEVPISKSAARKIQKAGGKIIKE